MKRLVVVIIIGIVLLLTFTNMTHSGSLEVGDTIPTFSLKDQDGNDFNIDAFRGQKPMVIYFYPKDDTPGCTKEACSFRDAYETFNDMDVKVIGVSADDVTSHKKFAKKYRLPFTLLADTNNKVRKQFGVPKSLLGLLPGRVTYIVNKNGIISYIFDSQFNAKKHISESLSILKKMKHVED